MRKPNTKFMLFSAALLTACMFVVRAAFALNFSGHQSLNGLQTTTIFQAPITGVYFIKGRLQFSPAGNENKSDVQSLVYKNGQISLYVGVSGAQGFAVPAVALATSDTVYVQLVSDSSNDQGLNAVRGDVFFGNR